MNRRNFLTQIPSTWAALSNALDSNAQTNVTAVAGFDTKPYLQNITPTSVSVGFITTENCFSCVEYGETINPNRKAYDTHGGMAVVNNRINNITLENLEAGKTYYYRIAAKKVIKFAAYDKQYGTAFYSALHSFVMPNIQNCQEVSALIVNDTKGNGASIPALIALNGSRPYQWVCFNGDMVKQYETEDTIVSEVINPACNTFATAIPFWYVRGNMELRGRESGNFYRYFKNGNNEAYNAFRWGPLFVIMLDGGEDKEDANSVYFGLSRYETYRKQQAQWLQQQIELEEWRTASFRVAITHYPLYNGGESEGIAQARDLFSPLLIAAKVDLLIAGHSGSRTIFEPDNTRHQYAIAIGGDNSDGNRTLMQLTATEKALSLNIIDEAGNSVGRFEQNISSESSQPKESPLYAYRGEDGSLCIKYNQKSTARIFNSNGSLLRTVPVDQTITSIYGLATNSVYLIRIHNHSLSIYL